MKTTRLWPLTALLRAPAALAQSTGTSASPTTTTSAAPSCTASLITSLCSYPEPGPEFSVASDGKASCWNYCNAHKPCSFVIFAAGNPITGTGTCWLYPGEAFDASKGSSDCGNPFLSVYGQPTCAGGSATTATSGACAATATPSAIAEVCGYPAPGDCFEGCNASSGAPDCLSQCAKAEACSYVVFNPSNPSTSPYASGNCWIYPNGTYNPESATACRDTPQQFVYNNLCPKPSPSSSSISPSASAGSSGTGTTGTTPASTTTSRNSAPTVLAANVPLAIGVAALIWQGLQ